MTNCVDASRRLIGRIELANHTNCSVRPRFQFTLRDLLFVSALTCAGVCLWYSLLLPTFAKPTPCLGRVAAGGSFLCVLTISVMTWLGALNAFRRERAPAQSEWVRAARVLVWVALTWLFVMVPVFMPNMVRSRCSCNESAAIAACKTYAEAQDIYRRTDWDGDGVLEYAQSLRGNFSLFEKTAGLGDLQLIDPSFACAEGLPAQGQPKGYVFKILNAQGPHAPCGRKSYLTVPLGGQGADMTAGYALVATPSAYDFTGCHTFIIDSRGTVYQKDLGPDSASIFAAMTEFDPGPGWEVAE